MGRPVPCSAMIFSRLTLSYANIRLRTAWRTHSFGIVEEPSLRTPSKHYQLNSSKDFRQADSVCLRGVNCPCRENQYTKQASLSLTASLAWSMWVFGEIP